MMPDPSRVNDSESIDATNQSGPGSTQISSEATLQEPAGAPTEPRSSLLRKLWPPVILVLLIAASALLWLRQDQVLDWVRLRGYTPAANIKEIAQQTTMTPYGQRLFYVNRPAIEDKASFNSHCPNASKEVAVLGCYRGDRQGIYVYNVTDARLSGIEQVTAAHEMLHQAYDRLGASEKNQINAQLEAYYQTITDTALKEKLDAYKKIEPNDLVNEMHSIFGTEVSKLPVGLENYYKRYFTNRQQLLAYHDQYQSAFTQRQERIAAIDAQLVAWKKQLDADNATITASEKEIQQERTEMDGWLHDNQISKYNAAVPGFNAKVESYKQLVGDTNTLINQYNAFIDERNTLAVQEAELIKAQNSNASSADTQ
ncbi:MAG TPA: hypothetical protein VGO07_06350 [Candidatus Saccharimonadales bacterium]|jgi:Skp family chaperone for outer membrane proteins|nr:hypothetical protein [Candidatus Saccharimonadales bacterium]